MNCKSWVANLSVCVGGDGLLKSFDSGSKGKSKSYYTFRLFLHDRWVWVFHEEFSDLINAQIWQTLWHHTPFIDAWDHQMRARLDKTNWWLKFFFFLWIEMRGWGSTILGAFHEVIDIIFSFCYWKHLWVFFLYFQH